MRRLFLFLIISLTIISRHGIAQNIADSAAVEKMITGKPLARQAKMLDSMALILQSRQPARAIEYANRALKILRDPAANARKSVGEPLTTLAKIYKRLGDVERAKQLLRQAEDTNIAVGNTPGLITTYLDFGTLYYMTGDYANSIAYFNKVTALAEKDKDRLSEALAQTNVGNAYYMLGEFDKAQALYRASYKTYVSMNDSSHAVLTLDNIANVYAAKDDYDSSFIIHRQALAQLKRIGDGAQLSESYNNFGTLFDQKGELDSAVYYFRLGVNSAHDASYSMGEASSLLNLGDLEMNHGKLGEAEADLEHAVDVCNRSGLPQIKAECYKRLILINEQGKQSDRALLYYHKLDSLKDSLFNVEKAKQLANFRTRFEVDQKDKNFQLQTVELERKQAALGRSQVLNYAFAIGSFLLVLLIFIFIRTNIQRRKTNRLLAEQNAVIANKNKDITDSINYAQRIQVSVLPDERILRTIFPESFLLYRPRDIVSGDFYWFAEKDRRLYVACADCTGHGVPGALVSVVGVNMLNQIIGLPGTPDTGEVLKLLHRFVVQALNKDVNSRDTKDGMDIALLCFDRDKKELLFSGAGRPLFVADENGVQLIKGDRFSVGGEKAYDDDTAYTVHRIAMKPGTTFYLTTDGFTDQFGEKTGKKFLIKRFGELLESTHRRPMNEQQDIILRSFEEWKGRQEQIDDVLVMGIKV